MKRIILTTSLFFCLTITTILAQVVTTNIAAPDSNGFSNNQVSDFDVHTDGTILNNSAADGTATLGSTAVTGNSNITAGNEASLILLQVTGTSGSDLDGTIEVFGDEAGLIIANPNGIVCDGCGFINTNRVDLVTGSGYDADTNRFGTIAATEVTIEGDALDAVNVDFLHIQAGRDFINSTTIDAESLSITAGVDFNNSGAIVADTLTIEVTSFVDDISNSGTVTADSLNFILTNNFSTSATSFNAFNFRNLAIITDATFTNNSDIELDGNLTITANTFTNNAQITLDGNLTITANSFSLNQGIDGTDTVTIEVPNLDNDISSGANIKSNSLNLIFTDDFLYLRAKLEFISSQVENLAFTTNGSFANLFPLTLVGSFTVKANRISIDDTITAATVTLEAPNFANDIFIASTVSSASLNFILTDDFTYTGDSFANFNNFSNLAITTEGTFISSVDLDLVGSLTVKANSIEISDTINADTVTFEVPNFVNDITNASTVSSDSLNFILTDDFTHTSTSFAGFNNFSNLAVTTEGTFTNNNTIAPTGNLTITANSFDNSGGVVSADTFSLSVAGNFDYGTITTNALNLQVGGDFSYDDSANDFTWRANDSLVILGNFNIVAAGFENSGNITVTNSLNLTADTFSNSGGVLSADTLALSVAGDFDYSSDYLNNGTITANSLNLTVGGNFSYDDSANDFVLGDNDSLVVSGSANIVAAGFANSGTITVTDSLNLTADTFTNSGGVLNADTFALNVAGDFDYGTITANTYNLQVGGNFNYDDSANNFIWGVNDTLTVSGDANIVAADFANSGNITVANSLNVTADTFANSGGVLSADTFALSVAGDFDYGTITANTYNLQVGGDFSYNDSANNFTWGVNDSLVVLGTANIVAADFANSGIITVTNNFNATVANFTNETGATITAAECNLVHDSFTDNGTITCLDSVDTTITNIAVPNSSGLSTNSYETFHIPLNGRVFNNSDSATTSQLLGDISKNPNYNDGDAASIILAQVSGTDISLLLGTFEVVGAEAVVIIANPNGISCNACNFINASRVDLVTGSSYNFNADRFNSIANSNIAIIDNGLNASAVDILNIHAGSFTNTGVLEANTFNLNVVGDFDNTQRGIINATIFNLEVGGDFSNNDASIGFVWEERDTLTVLGNANITALNFINHGSIDITNSFEITAGYTAINQGSIVSEYGSLDITANDFFRNLTGGDIAANTLNIIAGGKVTNTATIDVATLNITANNNSARTDDRTGFYVSNRGNITATNLNIAAVDNFYNRGNITAANFTTSAKSVFLLNREIDSYDGTYDGGNISLNGDSSFRADGGSIENYGNIDLGVFNLDISADSFTNHASANITANTVNITVNSYIHNGDIDATIINNTSSIDATSDQ